MSSFQNPIGDKPKDPYENYRVEAIEKDKLAKEDNRRKMEEIAKEKGAFGSSVLFMLRKAADFILDFVSKKNSGVSEQKPEDHLQHLRAAFESLKAEDQSQNIRFLNHLSKIWHQVLEDALKLQQDTPIALKLKALIKKIQTFPQGQPHTLGYYLIEYAGQNWLPFPYMEMIQKLHEQHHRNPNDSVLDDWIARITEITSLLSNP